VEFTRLSSGGLPAAGHFASLTKVGGHLIAAGGPDNQPLNQLGAATKLAHGRAVGVCTAATVAPGSVRLERSRHANCGDPALYGLHVMPILYLKRRRPVDVIGVRIAVADRAAQDGYRLGPTVMSYEQCSDCGAQWIIGDHALWIYGPYVGGATHPADLLWVSITTGRVLQQFAMPHLVRSLLAVDANGLWIAPSIETGLPAGHLTARLRREYSSLYLIAPGAPRPREVVNIGNGIPWLVAARHRVWLQEPSHGDERIITFTGTTTRHLRKGPRQNLGRMQGDEFGNEFVPYAVNPASGVDAVLAPDNTHQTIVSYDTTTLAQRVLTTTPRADAEYQQPDAVSVNGSLYFLDAQLPLTIRSIPARLYRLDIR
jgi:hypothetical protein